MVEVPEQLSIICDRDDFRCWQDGQTLNIGLKRDWVLSEVGRLERELAELAIASRPINKVAIFCGGLRNLDLSGAMLLYRSAEQLKILGMDADFSGFKAEHFKFIKQVLTVNDQPVITAPRYSLYQRSLQKSTALIQSLSSSLKQRQQFMHTLCQELLRTLQQPRRLRWIATTRHIEEAGVNALPVVVMMAFLIAVVLAFQGQNQLSRFGAEIFTIDLVAISVLREMGVLLTAIMIAGRSGSAFAAEIGVMQLNEEVDAMTTMGIRPFEVLVIPRVLALLISLPLLSFIADIAGLLGTLAVATSLLDIPFNLVIERFLSLQISSHFMVGMIKAPFFAIAIALTACYRGFYVSKSADAVGRNTTRAVVESIFMIIMVDAIFSVIFAQLNW
ncbi:MlaE family ABC transporter permease [Dasania marina]|uniref:MlaE family ABC transporter permease n=1 Tax=Dasania marina TaxID=471499 RepID=UPI000360EE4C|nr:ABC transporter permease [Dasania marina]